MRRKLIVFCVAALLSACGRAPEPAATPASAAPAAAIDWREGGVDEAFAEARDKNKPVLLYWGAVWCPPCNQLKATVFPRPAFVEQTRQFVAVHLDGDSPGAQKWGEYFGIAGYPTMIVLKPDRSETLRLSGVTDVEQFPKVLALALRQTASAAQLRDRALKQPADLSVDDWTLLANYGWEVDEARLAGQGQGAALLSQLAQACPVPALKPRFAIMALAARVADADKPEAALDAGAQAAAQALLLATLADAAQTRASHGELSYSGAAMIVAATPQADSAARKELAAALVPAMDRLYADAGLPVRDRLDGVIAELDLFHQQSGEQAAVPPSLADKVRQRVQWADAQSKTPFERQAVISDAASLLEAIGDRDAAEKLLLAELPRSEAAYYYMPHLSDLAAQRGDKAQAVDWLRKAYEQSQGPATRAQWGSSYVRGLIELKPDDAQAIEAAATQVIDEIAAHPDAYYQRTRGRMDKLAGALRQWAGAHQGAPLLDRLRGRMGSVCEKLPAQDAAAQASCKGWLAEA